MLAPIGGLNPFVSRAFADDGGTPRSPLFGFQPFTTPMRRFDVLARNDVSVLNPQPTAQSNQTKQPVNQLLGGGYGPIEGRPPVTSGRTSALTSSRRSRRSKRLRHVRRAGRLARDDEHALVPRPHVQFHGATQT
jgi:hypothetical protein